MGKLFELVCQYVHDEDTRKSVLKYCNLNCGWNKDEFIEEESFKTCLSNFKKEHPDATID